MRWNCQLNKQMTNYAKHHEEDSPRVNMKPDAKIIRHVPVVVLLIALIITVFAWRKMDQHVSSLEQERFSNQLAQVRSKIKARMIQYEQVLRSCVALHDSSTIVDRSEWRTFVEGIEVQQWFPGIQGIGFAVPVGKSDLKTFEAEIRSEGFPDFQVTPTEDREKYTAIKFIEPFDWRNQRALGFDMYSNSIRREAMDRAALTGRAAVSGKIILVQETKKDIQAGILFYLPLYKHDALLNTRDQRRQALRGWVYAAFRCDDLMAGILGEDASKLSLEIFDTKNIADDNILFDSRSSKHESRSHKLSSDDNLGLSKIDLIELFGRDWSVRLTSARGLYTTSEALVSSLIGIGGIIVSFLLFFVLFAVTRQREKAIQLARQMTVGLRQRELHNRAIVENASEAILTVTVEGTITAANQASHIVFRSQSSLKGKQFNQLIVKTTLEELAEQSKQVVGPEIGSTVQGRRADGQPFPCRVSVDQVAFNDSVYFVVIVRDQTARVEAAVKLADQNKKLVDASHRAGKAEVATGVLHNVGNVLNSVNVSANMLKQRIEASPVAYLVQAAEIIEKNKHDLESFFMKDRRGKHFPQLLNQMTSSFQKERDAQMSELESLSDNINHIKEIVSLQQSFAKKGTVAMNVVPAEVFEDAIKMNDSDLQWYATKIVKEFADVPSMSTSRHDVIQILVNLIRNAHQAIEATDAEEGEIRLSIREVDAQIVFTVQDSGMGIDPKNMQNLFQHGFTTKATGHGFGLHSCAIAAQELGGTLTVESDGPGQGATFALTLPIKIESSSTAEESEETDSRESSFTRLEPGLLTDLATTPLTEVGTQSPLS